MYALETTKPMAKLDLISFIIGFPKLPANQRLSLVYEQSVFGLARSHKTS